MNFTHLLLLIVLSISTYGQSFFYNNNKKVILIPYYEPSATNTRNISISNIKYYKQSNNKIIGIDNTIFIKLKAHHSIDFLLKKYNLTMVRIYNETLYLVSIENTADTLSISNKLYNEISTTYVQPNIYNSIKMR